MSFIIGSIATPLKSPCDHRERGRSVRAKRVCETERGVSRGGAVAKRQHMKYLSVFCQLSVIKVYPVRVQITKKNSENFSRGWKGSWEGNQKHFERNSEKCVP